MTDEEYLNYQLQNMTNEEYAVYQLQAQAQQTMTDEEYLQYQLQNMTDEEYAAYQAQQQISLNDDIQAQISPDEYSDSINHNNTEEYLMQAPVSYEQVLVMTMVIVLLLIYIYICVCVYIYTHLHSSLYYIYPHPPSFHRPPASPFSVHILGCINSSGYTTTSYFIAGLCSPKHDYYIPPVL